ncbi:putative transporter YycB [mine drainage metagenome]|uniref:Putative transporter YycB n=1 Tax=mine drainage metagenome TaxID=410659 RepID=A0A1J5QKA4_9ZZZZ
MRSAPGRPGAPMSGRLLVLAGIVLVALNLRIAVAAVSPILDLVRVDVALDDAQAGLLGTVPVGMFALFGSLAPLLARRFAIEPVLVVAMLVSAAGEIARSGASGPWAFLFWSAVALAGMGVGNVLLPPLVKRYFPDRIGLVTAVYSTALAVSTMLPPLLAVPVARAVGWRVSLGVWAVVGVAAALPWIGVMVRSGAARRRARVLVEAAVELRNGETQVPSVPGAPPRQVVPAGSTGAVWRSPLAWGMALMFSMNSLNAYTMFAWLPQILVDAGIDDAGAGRWLAVFSLVGIPTSFVVPLLATRMRNPLAIVVVFEGCLVVGYLGLMLSPASGTAAWTLLAGLGLGSFPLALALMNLRTRSSAGAVRLSGFSQGVGYAVAGVGPVLVGVLHGATGGWTAPFVLLFVSLALLLAGAVVACRPVMLEDTWERRSAASGRVVASVGSTGDPR